MSKLVNTLRSVRVFNDYEFFGKEPYIYYCRADYRECWPNGSYVCQKGVNLAGKYGRCSGCAFFTGNMTESILEAKAWAEKRFGIAEWTRSPFGAYGESDFVKRRIAELKERAAKQEKP